MGERFTYDGLTPIKERRPWRYLAPALAVAVVAGVAAIAMAGEPSAPTATPSGASTLSASTRASMSVTPVSPSPAVSPSSPPTPILDGGDDTPVDPSQVSAAVVPVVQRFTDGWLLRKDPVSRLEALSPVATPRLAAALSRTDPTRIPVARRLGVPAVLAAGPYAVRCRQGLTDGTSILLDLVSEPGPAGTRWLVTTVRPGE